MLRRVLILSMLAACTTDGLSLVVDLKTDLEPTIEFAAVRLELYVSTVDGPDLDSVRLRESDARADGYLSGVRIGEYEDLTPGDYLLRAVLTDARGGAVLARDVRVSLRATLGVTVVMTRDCRGVACPDPGGDARLTSCLAGRCVDPACLLGSEIECPVPECAVDEGCVPPVACADGVCLDGVCLFAGRADRCAAGEWCSPEGGCMRRPGMMMGTCIPIVEACNTIDDDCDLIADEGFDFEIDVANCGGCGNTCTLRSAMERCAGGTCTVAACDLGFGDCDADASNGCETALGTTTNCSACGDACMVTNATSSCDAGACAVGTCDPGYGDCDADPSNGCETDLTTSSDCGGCGTTCDTSAPLCAAGTCVTGCPPAMPTICGGSCVSTATDPRHCGGCGSGCLLANATPACSDGSCVIAMCDDGFGDCDGMATNGCERTLQTFFRDMDMDGLGDASMPTLMPECAAPAGFVDNEGDCDDSDGLGIGIMPETCNDADDDCDGRIDEGRFMVVGSVDVTHPQNVGVSPFGPDIAWNGSEIGVVWSGNASDGTDSELWFARVPPSLTPMIASYRLTTTPNGFDAQSGGIAWGGAQWLVAYTETTIGSAEAYWSFLAPATYTASFLSLGTNSALAWVEPGAPGTVLVGRSSLSVFQTSVVPITLGGGAGPGVPLASSFHGSSGLVYLGGGNVGFAVHSGITGNQVLGYERKAETSGATNAMVGALTPPMSMNGGPVGLARNPGSTGRELAMVTQTSWAGGPARVVVVRLDEDATDSVVTSFVSAGGSMLGASARNQTFAYTEGGNFVMSTFDGQHVPPNVPIGVFGAQGIAGNFGAARYVIAYGNGAMGVRLVGIGCL